MEAPASVIEEYKYRAAQDCFLAFADIMKKGDLKVVGVNCFKEGGESSKVEIMRIPPGLEVAAVERIRAYRSQRSEATTQASLRALEDGARGGANLQSLILHAVKSGATLGETADALRRVFGLYREYSGF